MTEFNPTIVNEQDGDILMYDSSISNFRNVHLFEQADRIITFNPSMTATEIQTKIDEVGKILLKFNQTQPVPRLTFQFEDGTYTLDKPLFFGGFQGGMIDIQGNLSEDRNSLHTNQAVFLDFSSSNDPDGTLCIGGCTSVINILNLRIKFNTLNDYTISGIRANDFANVRIHGCWVYGTNDSQGYAIWMDYATFCRINYTYLGNAKYGIFAANCAIVHSAYNDNNPTQSLKFGLRASGTATIGRGGTQPSGTIANTQIAVGGEIR